MFSQLMFVRLKAAENALRDGRWDEAFRLASAVDLREHRRGAAVLKNLAQLFIERAREHYRADRFAEALADLDCAEAGGVLADDIAELRGHVHTVSSELQRREADRRQRMDAAALRIEGGSLAAGRRILDEASRHDGGADELRRGIERRAEDMTTLVEEIEHLIEQDRLAAAAERARRVRSVDAHHPRLIELEGRLCEKVLKAAREALVAGRLNRASDELSCLGALGGSLPSRRELETLLTTAKDAAGAAEAGRYADALRQLLTLGRLIPEAKWVVAAVKVLRQIEELRTVVAGGPLGEVVSRKAAAKGHRARPANLDDTIALPPRGVSPNPVAASQDRLLLLVDGGGSYLICRGDQTSIGRAAAKRPADVTIFADLGEHHAQIVRADEDYFLYSTKDVEIGGRKTRHHLLRDGDRVVLGRKAKFTFHMPSRQSSTAVLDLSDTTKMPNDVRRILLLQHHATLGSGRAAHIACRHAGPPLVLFERKGSLWIRQRGDGHVDTEAQALKIGAPVEIGGASLVLQNWQVRPLGMGTV